MFTPGTRIAKAIKAQIAVDGNYEKALQIYPPYDYSKAEVMKFISGFSKSVSIEFFYKTDDNRTSYLGIKYKPQAKISLSAQEFTIKSLDTFASNQNFYIFVPALGETINNDQLTFLNSRPSQIELGVNEWWFTFGPLLIWKDGDDKPTKESLTVSLSGREDLRLNPRNFVGAEVISMNPIEHWLSTQVSQPKNDKYAINIDQILAITDSVQ